MKINKTFIFLIIFLAGIVTPFIPSLVIFEMFFLLAPFIFIFIVTSIYLIVSFLKKNIDSRNAMFLFLLLPIYISSQFFSVLIVNKIQRVRSENFIKEIKKVKSKIGKFPETVNTSTGITYTKKDREEEFIIQYSRGFLVREKYDSKYDNWKSYGWND